MSNRNTDPRRLCRYLSAAQEAAKHYGEMSNSEAVIAALVVAAALDDHAARLEPPPKPPDPDVDGSWLK